MLSRRDSTRYGNRDANGASDFFDWSFIVTQPHQRNPKGWDRRTGASLLEMMVVISIATFLLTKATSSFNNVRGTTQVRGAVEAYAGMVHLARAQAVEHGTGVRLMTNITADSVWIERGGQVVQGKSFSRAYDVDLRSNAATLIRVCYTPKGYADPDCNSYTGELDMSIRNSTHAHGLSWLEMGQLLR